MTSSYTTAHRSQEIRRWLRDTANVLDIETLNLMLKRFNTFIITSNFSTEKEALNSFLAPAYYKDFIRFSNMVINYHGEEVIFLTPYYFNSSTKKQIIPNHAIVHPKPRFGNFAGPTEIPFPIDSDLRIRCNATKVKPSHPYDRNISIFISLNELKGLCQNGRDAHWSDLYNKDPKNCETQSGHSWLHSASSWFSDPLYRVTPKWQPKVDEILSKGMKIQTLSQEVYIIEGIQELFFDAPERPKSNRTFSYFSLSLFCIQTNKSGYHINYLVAINGRIKSLFYYNDPDEVHLLPKDSTVAQKLNHPPIKAQLTLF